MVASIASSLSCAPKWWSTQGTGFLWQNLFLLFLVHVPVLKCFSRIHLIGHKRVDRKVHCVSMSGYLASQVYFSPGSSESGHHWTTDKDISFRHPKSLRWRISDESQHDGTFKARYFDISALPAGLLHPAKRKCKRPHGALANGPNTCVFSPISGPPKHKPPPPVKAGSSTEMVSGPTQPANQSPSPGLYSAHSFKCQDSGGVHLASLKWD